MENQQRLFIKINRDNLPRVSDRYPFIYLERGRLEIDDSSVKWIDSDGNVVRLPMATLNTILLGPGTSVTHEAIKVMTASNCTVCWVGEDSLLFYAVGQSPTHDTRNVKLQAKLASNPKTRLTVSRKLFAFRFPEVDVIDKSQQQLMGMEGKRVKDLYQALAEKYHVGWKGRSYKPGRFELSDTTNRMLTSMNTALYGILTSVIYHLGYSPHIGFIHSGSPLPFVYDIADLYKDELCIENAFRLTKELAGNYNRAFVANEFRKEVVRLKLLYRVPSDIENLLRTGDGSSNSE